MIPRSHGAYTFLFKNCLGLLDALRQWVEPDQLLLLGENDGKRVKLWGIDER
jgi:hypothetical protein